MYVGGVITVRVEVVAPEYREPLDTLLHPEEVVRFCHWYVIASPPAVMLNVAFPPSQIVWFVGLVDTAGRANTVIVAALLVTGEGQAPLTIQRYWPSFMDSLGTTAYVEAFPPLMMSLQPVPLFPCH